MQPTKKRDLEFKRIGTLSVPFSQGRFAQLLLWLKQDDGECPLDLSILPDAPPGPGNLADSDIFFVFREIRVEENEERNEIVFVYDRMRVVSGGVIRESTQQEYSNMTDKLQDLFANRVAERIYEKYQIVLSKDLLKRLRSENPALRETEDEDAFIETLRDLGLFSTSAPYAEQLATEVHLGDDVEVSDDE